MKSKQMKNELCLAAVHPIILWDKRDIRWFPLGYFEFVDTTQITLKQMM